MGKGAIARSPVIFSKDLNSIHIKTKAFFGKGLTLSRTSPGFYVYAIHILLKTTAGNGEIAHNDDKKKLPTTLSIWLKQIYIIVRCRKGK